MHHRIMTLAAGAALVVVLSAAGASAASVGCTPNSGHPVCRANYAAYPKGALRAGQPSSGTAVVKGQTVSWTCTGGIAAGSKSVPRQCTY